MYSKEEVLNLKEQLTAHFDSYTRLLTEVTGLTRPTINKFFRYDDSVRPSNQDLIYSTGIELIKSKKKIRKKRVSELEELCNSTIHKSALKFSK